MLRTADEIADAIAAKGRPDGVVTQDELNDLPLMMETSRLVARAAGTGVWFRVDPHASILALALLNFSASKEVAN